MTTMCKWTPGRVRCVAATTRWQRVSSSWMRTTTACWVRTRWAPSCRILSAWTPPTPSTWSRCSTRTATGHSTRPSSWRSGRACSVRERRRRGRSVNCPSESGSTQRLLTLLSLYTDQFHCSAPLGVFLSSTPSLGFAVCLRVSSSACLLWQRKTKWKYLKKTNGDGRSILMQSVNYYLSHLVNRVHTKRAVSGEYLSYQ